MGLGHHGPNAALILFWVWEALVIVGLAALVGLAIRSAVTGGRPQSAAGADAAEVAPSAPSAAPGVSARVILEERFARGEIDAKEFKASIATIGASS